jgi:hypothetical protein
MNMHERLAAPDLILVSSGTSRRPCWLRLLRTRLAVWDKIGADHYAGAVAYDNLSRLSDTQLKHRGLSRDILARDLRTPAVASESQSVGVTD